MLPLLFALLGYSTENEMLISGQAGYDVTVSSTTPLYLFTRTVKRVGISSETFAVSGALARRHRVRERAEPLQKVLRLMWKLSTETAACRCQVVFIFIFRHLLKPLHAAQASEREIIRGRMCIDVRIWSSDVKIKDQFKYRTKSFLNSMFSNWAGHPRCIIFLRGVCNRYLSDTDI